jgi:hypothetical protein
VVLRYYVDYLKEFGEPLLVSRPPTTSGQWQGSGVTYETFALEKSLTPATLFAGIIDSTLEFSPSGLVRAVEKARKEAEKLEASNASDDNGDDDASAESGEKPKKKRLPSIQPAFDDIITGIESGLEHSDYGILRDPCVKLVQLCKIMKISKIGGAESCELNEALELYIRDAHKAAKEAAKHRVLVPDSDHSTGSELVGGDEDYSDMQEID